MGLMDTIAQDIKSILTNTNDFGVNITLYAPTSPQKVVTVGGTVKKHHLTFDENGMVKGNVKNATCTVSELSLNAANYPVRNANGEVTFEGHRVSWSDVNGTAITYAVNEWWPDERLGVLVLILGDYE